MESLSYSSSVSSLFARRKLSEVTERLGQNFERLSSGLRINNASDDPAGLAVSSELNSDIRVFSQGVRNVNDGISLLNVAEAATQELTALLTRLGELANQAASGTYTLTQRKALDDEALALTNEYNRIVQSTSFNDVKLLDGTNDQLALQLGYSSVSVGSGEQLERARGLGTYTLEYDQDLGSTVNSIESGDFNGDGNLDVVTAHGPDDVIRVSFGNGDGTFQASVSYATGARATGVVSGDLNGDGILDLAVATQTAATMEVFLGNADGTFAAGVAYTGTGGLHTVDLGDLDGDGDLDVVAGGLGDQVAVYLNNGNGTFASEMTFATPGDSHVEIGDLNGDGRLDVAAASTAGDVHVLLGNGDGTLQDAVTYATGGETPAYISLGDIDYDGDLDILAPADSELFYFFGNGDGTFETASSFNTSSLFYSGVFTDVNGDGILDVLSGDEDPQLRIFIGNGDGTFQDEIGVNLTREMFQIDVGDFNNDGALDFVSGNGSGYVQTYIAETEQVTTLGRLYLLTSDGARESAATIEAALNRVTTELADLGAYQSRLGSALGVLSSTVENYQAANSRIVDADIAQETANLVRDQVLQQATAAVLAQANQSPSLVLTLLQGAG